MIIEGRRNGRAYARDKAHMHFDRLWKSKRMSRQEAYTRLAQAMGLTEDECHMCRMKVKACRKVVWICTGAMQGMPLKEHAEKLTNGPNNLSV